MGENRVASKGVVSAPLYFTSGYTFVGDLTRTSLTLRFVFIAVKIYLYIPP